MKDLQLVYSVAVCQTEGNTASFISRITHSETLPENCVHTFCQQLLSLWLFPLFFSFGVKVLCICISAATMFEGTRAVSKITHLLTPAWQTLNSEQQIKIWTLAHHHHFVTYSCRVSLTVGFSAESSVQTRTILYLFYCGILEGTQRT